MSKLGREISILLMRPDEWECDKYHLTHKPTDIQLWIANGALFFDVEGHGSNIIGIFERHWLWFTQARSLVKKMKPRNPTKEQKAAEVLAIIEKSKISSEEK